MIQKLLNSTKTSKSTQNQGSDPAGTSKSTHEPPNPKLCFSQIPISCFFTPKNSIFTSRFLLEENPFFFHMGAGSQISSQIKIFWDLMPDLHSHLDVFVSEQILHQGAVDARHAGVVDGEAVGKEILQLQVLPENPAQGIPGKNSKGKIWNQVGRGGKVIGASPRVAHPSKIPQEWASNQLCHKEFSQFSQIFPNFSQCSKFNPNFPHRIFPIFPARFSPFSPIFSHRIFLIFPNFPCCIFPIFHNFPQFFSAVFSQFSLLDFLLFPYWISLIFPNFSLTYFSTRFS